MSLWVSYSLAILLSAAVLVLVAGCYWKIRQYIRTPAPLKIPTTPAPTTLDGVVLRVLGELLLFKSLFRANKLLWVLGWTMHLSLLLLILRHLPFFLPNVPLWLYQAQQFAPWVTLLFVVSLLGLLLRRALHPQMRYISAISDYLHIVLLLAIAASGAFMAYIGPSYPLGVRSFSRGLLEFDWQAIPHSPVLWLHLILVAVLMLIFPFSKLLHAPGLFFSPTRIQRDNSREARHLVGWVEDAEENQQRSNSKS